MADAAVGPDEAPDWAAVARAIIDEGDDMALATADEGAPGVGMQPGSGGESS